MPRLSIAQQDARRAVIALESTTLPLEQVGHRLLQAIEPAVPFDGYRLLGTDPATLLVNRLIAASSNDTWARSEWLRDVYLRTGLPHVELPNLMRMNKTAVAYQSAPDLCWGFAPEVFGNFTRSEHLDTFHQTRSPLGGALFANFAAYGSWVASLQIYRRDPDTPFQRGEIAFMQLIGPAVGRAIDAGMKREHLEAQSGQEIPQSSGVIVIDREGRLRFANPAGEFWRELLQDTGEPTLATPIASSIAALASLGKPSATVVVNTPAGPARIEASPESSGHDVTLVITPERTPPPPPLPAAWSLTPQESQVVAHLLQGDSNAQIASTLMISRNTVQTHLRHIYEKLNVNNRTQVLAAYFREGYAPEPGGDG